MKKRRFFGLIPAAGRSRRMGTHKLLMPWKTGRVIDVVLDAWGNSIVDYVVIVVRNDDQNLIDACASRPVTIVKLNDDTIDMKQTIQHGLQFIKETWEPTDDDICIVAPADLPKLSFTLINLVANESDGERVVTPIYGDKNGHPTGIPWPTTSKIFELGVDEGLDSLIRRSSKKRIPLKRSLRPRDIDTPDDYKREVD